LGLVNVLAVAVAAAAMASVWSSSASNSMSGEPLTSCHDRRTRPERRPFVSPHGAYVAAPVEESGWRAQPPRVPQRPVCYPVMNEWYATKTARERKVPHAGVGFMCEFGVGAE